MRKLYCRQKLVWLRLLGPTRATLGFTRAGIDNIGSIVSARRAVDVGDRVGRGHPLVSLSWEGYSRTAADELYHAVWESTEGVADLQAPIESMTVTKFNDLETLLDKEGPLYDEDTWLCEAEFDENVALDSLLDQDSYEAWEAELRERGEAGLFQETELNSYI